MTVSQFFSEYWETIVAICALIVSIVAVTISWLGLKIQRTHNQKSLKPIIFIEPYDYENCILIKIRNEGLGPAIVKRIRVENDKLEEKSSIFNWLPPILPANMNYREYWTRSKNFVLRPGSLDHMLEIPVNTDDPIQIRERDKIRSILKDLTVHVEYGDIYENTMPTFSRKLFLFGRKDHENTTRASNMALKGSANNALPLA